MLACLLSGTMAVALCVPSVVYADSQKVVTLGADLSPDQKQAILKYFGVLGQNIQTLTITNQDERNHLGAYVPLEQIGTHTFSCALVCPTSKGGIQVKTANLNWVTSNMIASTLSTAGVVNCDVLAASPFEVSGTGALTGVIMAYESAAGISLSASRKDLANQELVTTGLLADSLGQQEATKIVNDIKIQIIEGQVQQPEEVSQVINEIVEEEPEISLTQEEYEMLQDLMNQIAEEGYDFNEMKDTLNRVEQNVTEIKDQMSDLQPVQPQVADSFEEGFEEQFYNADEELSSDSILLQTDDEALGSNVIFDATNEQAVETTPQNEEPDEFDMFEITSNDEYADGDPELELGYEEPGDAFEIPAAEENYEEFDLNEEFPAEEEVFEIDDDFFGDEEMLEFDFSDGEEFEFTDGDSEFDFAEEFDLGEDFEEQIDELTDGEEEPDIDDGDTGVDLGNVFFNPDATFGETAPAGLSQFRISCDTADVAITGGSLVITDESGNATNIDLSDSSRTGAVSSEFGGTELVINTGLNLNASSNYTADLNAEVTQLSTGSITELSTSWPVTTDAYGVELDFTSSSEISAGTPVTGTLTLNDEVTYAEITDFDESILSFDKLALEDFTFTMTGVRSGNTSFTVDFFDGEGNYLASETVDVTIL